MNIFQRVKPNRPSTERLSWSLSSAICAQGRKTPKYNKIKPNYLPNTYYYHVSSRLYHSFHCLCLILTLCRFHRGSACWDCFVSLLQASKAKLRSVRFPSCTSSSSRLQHESWTPLTETRDAVVDALPRVPRSLILLPLPIDAHGRCSL